MASSRLSPTAHAKPQLHPQSVNCDLCGYAMPPPAVTRNGLILGLLVCSQCVEDNLDARTVEPRSEVGLVGGRR